MIFLYFAAKTRVQDIPVRLLTGHEVLKPVNIKIIFCAVMSCNFVGNRRFGTTCCLNLQTLILLCRPTLCLVPSSNLQYFHEHSSR